MRAHTAAAAIAAATLALLASASTAVAVPLCVQAPLSRGRCSAGLSCLESVIVGPDGRLYYTESDKKR